MRLKRRRRARIAGRHRRPRPYRAVPDLAPQTWRAWEAQNGGKRWYRRLPLAIEWALEWFVHWLRGLALFDLLELAGKLTILVAVVIWFLEADQRARQAEEAIKERHYRAWELINAAAGKAGDGGRRDALQDLNKEGVSLVAAPLEKAYLPVVGLQGAELAYANLQGAHLGIVGLQGAIGLTQEQLDEAWGDDRTVLPDGLTRPARWSKAQAPETPPTAQPDAAERAPAAAGAPDPAK